MNIIVCVKCVPETAEADLKIDVSGKDIEKAGLVFDINEWDEYALEEAIRIKEKHGGTVTVITVGLEESEIILRKCLAMGADNAIRFMDEKFLGSDAYATAKILHSIVKTTPYDLILTGVQASDDGYSMVGPILAEFLGIPHATMVKKIEVEVETLRVHRELEGGLGEVLEVKMPALLTVQTGINEPRYVSIMGIRKAAQKKIKTMKLTDVGLTEDDVGVKGSWLHIEKLYVPPLEKKAMVIKGSPDEVSAKIVEILRTKGLI